MFHNLPFREPHDTSLHRTVFFRPATAMGQFLPPSFVAGMEELASTPDTKGTQRLCILLIDAMTVAIGGKRSTAALR